MHPTADFTLIPDNSTKTKQVVLTAREREILLLVFHGSTAKEAASLLFVSRRTVEFHLANAYGKLNVNTKMAAMQECFRLGLLHPSQVFSTEMN